MSGGALLLDLDGTLIDTPGAIAEALGRVLGPGVDPAAIRRTIGKPLHASVAGLLGAAPDDPAVDAAVDAYRTIFNREIVPRAARLLLPDVVDTLDRARRSGWRTAVVTSKVRRAAVALIESASLDGYLDEIICDDMVGRGKPDPEMALLAARRLDLPPRRCVVIGDGVADIRMAAAAGMPSVGVTTGVGSAAELRDAGATEVADGFAAAVRLSVKLLDRT